MRFCPRCGGETGAQGPRNAGRPADASALRLVALFAAPLAAAVLIVECAAMLAGTEMVWNWCADRSMDILGLLPNLVVIASIQGIQLQIAWILIEAAVVASLGYTALRSWRVVRYGQGSLLEKVGRSDIYAIGTVYSMTLVLNLAIMLVSSSAGHGIEVPDELTTGFNAESLLSYADAGVWEEVISRVVPMGVPMAVAALAMRRGGAWRFLLGGFGISKLTLALIVVSALMFGFAHAGGWGLSKVAPTFASGLLLGYIYAKVGVHASIAVHFMTDYMAVVAYTDILPLSLLLSLATIAFIAIGAVCLLMHAMRAGDAKNALQSMETWVPDESESIFSRRGSD